MSAQAATMRNDWALAGAMLTLLLAYAPGTALAEGDKPRSAAPARTTSMTPAPAPAETEPETPAATGAEDPGEEKAKAHFRVGQSLYDSGRFREAAVEWQHAYDLSLRPELLYNVFVAHRDAGEDPAAAVALRSYLALAEVEAARRINLEARLRSLEEGVPAESEAAAAEQPAAAPAPSASTDTGATTGTMDDDSLMAIAPYALIGVGGAMVVAGGVTGLMTMSKFSEVEDGCPDNECEAGFNLERKRGDVEDLALVTDVLLVAGVALAGVGTVLLLLDDTEQAPAATSAPTASIGCAPGACMAHVSARF